jgi:sugar (pentulose or hexulose) kinase
MSSSTHNAVAAIDIGTNSTNLLVTDHDGRTLERQVTVTRLGQGVELFFVSRDTANCLTHMVHRCYESLRQVHRATRSTEKSSLIKPRTFWVFDPSSSAVKKKLDWHIAVAPQI